MGFASGDLSEARLQGRENDLVGRLFAIMGEKYAEDGVFLHMHTYRARVVFAGNHMRTASGMQADELFQEFSQTPAAVVF